MAFAAAFGLPSLVEGELYPGGGRDGFHIAVKRLQVLAIAVGSDPEQMELRFDDVAKAVDIKKNRLHVVILTPELHGSADAPAAPEARGGAGLGFGKIIIPERDP